MILQNWLSESQRYIDMHHPVITCHPENQLQYFKVLKTSDLLKIGSELQFKKIDYNLQKNEKEID